MITKPKAINDKAAKKIHAVLDGMEQKHQRLAMQGFTAAELLRLFINPEHHHTLTHAYQLCEPSGHTQELYIRCEVPNEFGGKVAYLRFSWHGLDTPHAFYVPYRQGSSQDYAAEIQYETAPPDLVRKFEQVRDELIAIAFEYANTHKMFRALNRNAVCATLAQMRYHWPCIVSLLQRAGFDEEADKVRTASSRAGDGAHIPPQLAPLLRATNETVARHAFIEDVPDPAKVPITYKLIEHFSRG